MFKRSPDTIPQVQSDNTGHQPGRPVNSLGNISQKTLFNNLIGLITYTVFQNFIPESFDLHRNRKPEIPSIAFHTDNRKAYVVDRRPRQISSEKFRLINIYCTCSWQWWWKFSATNRKWNFERRNQAFLKILT